MKTLYTTILTLVIGKSLVADAKSLTSKNGSLTPEAIEKLRLIDVPKSFYNSEVEEIINNLKDYRDLSDPRLKRKIFQNRKDLLNIIEKSGANGVGWFE